MPQRVILSLAVHNHQPVGNFPHVFESAYQQSYLPMVGALERHPTIRLALHYSGPLLDWLEDAHPEFFPRLRALVARGQVELMTGGYYEPILAIIPERDKHGQITKMTAYLRTRLGARALGFWLAERVWEPHLAKAIAQAGVEYTIVDDAHFLLAGLREDELTGVFITEEEGVSLKVFPSSKRLRYLIPWQSPGDVIAYLRSVEGSRTPILLMGDDGEKFGLWPGTYAHCWEQGWVEAFFRALEGAADWLAVLPPGEVAQHSPARRVYLPTAAYDEMMEWSGGYWRQFLVKYPEINTMHKKMLRVSKKVWAMPAGRRRQQALDELWQGQCNCPYWHGVFGGIYLPHIRRANFAHLIAAEAMADQTLRSPRVLREDLDGDGMEEIELASKAMVLTIDPDDGGSVVEWDWRSRRVNLINVLTRRPEAYHRQLQGAHAQPAVTAEAVETIHTSRVRVKEPGLERLLVYDWYRRVSFLDHVFGEDVTLEDFSRSQYEERGDFVNQPYVAAVVADRPSPVVALTRHGGVSNGERRRSLQIAKQFTLRRRGASLEVHYRLHSGDEDPLTIMFGIETCWGITDPDAALVLDEHPSAARVPRAEDGIRRIEFTDAGWDGAVRLEIPPARVWVMPLQTVSNSEAGFERIFQGVCCVCSWQITLPPRQAYEMTLLASFHTT